MLLNEILDDKVDYKVIEDSDDIFGTSASIGGRTIQFFAEKYEPGKWTLSFGELKGRKLTTDKTGNGSELAVFSMVKDSILEFVEKYDPKLMHFTAAKEAFKEKNNRGSLYARLINRFKIPGYKFEYTKGQYGDFFKLEKE